MRRRAWTRRWVLGDEGAQAVEFALILPVLLLIVLGIINFGYLFGQKLALNQAVREGARVAVVANGNGGTNGSGVNSATEIRDVVRGAVGTGLLTASSVSVAATPSTGCQAREVGQPITVSAQYNTGLLVPMPIPFLSSFTLTSQAVYRCEWQG